eukprot:TRINITY_DN12498_c1_g11_i1.p1 TRINITY_DN12498_c1_g11~~TRINITY_DN12498_c1_g11_i1.p1  ORF type:complete len:741 (+),score=147.78 TRINITY_DN12498_c1_g11_i1:47-2269(+)
MAAPQLGQPRQRRFGAYPKPKLDSLPVEEPPVRAGGWKTAMIAENEERRSRLEKQILQSMRNERRKKRELAKQVATRQELMTGSQVADTSVMLNEAFILEVCQVERPGDVSSLRIEDQDLSQADPSSFHLFSNLVHVIAGCNSLALSDFDKFPALQTLELPLNNIRDISLQEQQLAHLTQLDLSHNTLSSNALRSLGVLRSLTSLDLSQNDLRKLPLDMASSTIAFNQTACAFERLENLVLDGNRFDNPSVFQALAGLPRLTYLNLNHNKLQFVPNLVSDADDKAARPFPSLEVLSMTHNKFTTAADLIPLSLWPRLQVLHLAENPIAYCNVTLPEPLSDILETANGVTIHTKPVAPLKPPASVPPNQLKHVDDTLPVLPQLAQLTLEVPKSPSLPAPSAIPSLPPISRQGSALPALHVVAEADDDNDDGVDQASSAAESTFFMTEIGYEEPKDTLHPSSSLPMPPAYTTAIGSSMTADTSTTSLALVSTIRPVLSAESIQVPSNPHSSPFTTQTTRSTKSTTTRRGIHEAKRLLGLTHLESAKQAATVASDDVLELLQTVEDIDPAGANEEDPAKVVAAVSVAKYRGYEELLMSDDEDEAHGSTMEPASRALVPVEPLPSNPKQAAKALEFALAHPPTLKNRQQRRQAESALEKLREKRQEPPLALTDGSEYRNSQATTRLQSAASQAARDASARSIRSRSELRTASSRTRTLELQAILQELRNDDGTNSDIAEFDSEL